MDHLLYILKFRLKQTWRLFEEAGWGYLIVLLLLLLGVMMRSLDWLAMAPPHYSCWAVGLILGGFHLRRQDGLFVKTLSQTPAFVYFSEYLLLVSPLLVFFIFYSNFFHILLLILTIGIISVVPTGVRDLRSLSSEIDFRWIPLEAFEWRSGFRRMFVGILFLNIIGILGSFYVWGILVLVLLALTVASFYDWTESRALFNVFYYKGNFIVSKIKIGVGLFLLSSLPVLLFWIVLNMQLWYISVVVLILGAFIVAFSILYKYAHYFPDRIRLYNSVAIGLFTGAVLLGVFIPVAIGFFIFYWYKCKNHLKMYFE